MPAVPAAGALAPPSGAVTDEWLEIDGFSLSTPGWIATDFSELIDANDFRTGSRVIPGTPGVLSYRQRVTLSARSVPLAIFGDADANGTPHPNGVYGSEANIMAIRAALFDPNKLATSRGRTITGVSVNSGFLNFLAKTGAFTADDVGRSVTGTGVAVGSTILGVPDASTAVLSLAPTATGTVTVTLGDISLSPRTDGTREAILHLAIGDLTARVKVTGSLTPTYVSPGFFRAIIKLDLPYGPFA